MRLCGSRVEGLQIAFSYVIPELQLQLPTDELVAKNSPKLLSSGHLLIQVWFTIFNSVQLHEFHRLNFLTQSIDPELEKK